MNEIRSFEKSPVSLPVNRNSDWLKGKRGLLLAIHNNPQIVNCLAHSGCIVIKTLCNNIAIYVLKYAYLTIVP